MINKCIADLFKALGFPAIQAPGEAEAMCASLQQKGIVSACATKDSDALIFGATKVFHTMNLQVNQAGPPWLTGTLKMPYMSIEKTCWLRL